MKAIARALLRQNYTVTRTYHRLKRWVKGSLARETVTIYTMPKVGSTTVWQTLERSEIEAEFYHVHTLRPDKIAQLLDRDRLNFPRLRFANPETANAAYLRAKLDSGSRQSWKVVTLVRDPIAQTVSWFFEFLEAEQVRGHDRLYQVRSQGRDAILHELTEIFQREGLATPERRQPLSWLDRELRANLNFDIFQQPSLADRRYSIYRCDTADILVIKLEALNDCFTEAFSEFFGVKIDRLVPSNLRSDDRDFREIYKAFLKSIEFPSGYLDSIYSDASVRHLYSDADIAKFRDRWMRR